jgi:hypothetical protein
MSSTSGLQSMRRYMTEKAAADVRSGWKVGLLTTDDGLEGLAAQCREQGLTYWSGHVQDTPADAFPDQASLTKSKKNEYSASNSRALPPLLADVILLSLGQRQKPHLLARSLYAALRRFDKWGMDRIYAESVNKSGIGEALMNRLMKAAGGKTLYIP